jgi:hypothetical protein
VLKNCNFLINDFDVIKYILSDICAGFPPSIVYPAARLRLEFFAQHNSSAPGSAQELRQLKNAAAEAAAFVKG